MRNVFDTVKCVSFLPDRKSLMKNENCSEEGKRKLWFNHNRGHFSGKVQNRHGLLDSYFIIISRMLYIEPVYVSIKLYFFFSIRVSVSCISVSDEKNKKNNKKTIG